MWVQVESRLHWPARWVTTGNKSLERVVKGYKELKGVENRRLHGVCGLVLTCPHSNTSQEDFGGVGAGTTLWCAEEGAGSEERDCSLRVWLRRTGEGRPAASRGYI